MYTAVLQKARRFVDFEDTLLRDQMARVAPRAKGRLLDVGCGDKPYEALFEPFVTEYVGAEWAPSYTSSHYAPKGRADVVFSGDVLPFESDAFDTVLCTQVAEHVANPRALFAEITRVLRRGGILILTVPFSFRIHSQPYDFHRFTRFALESYASDNGLDVELLEPRGQFWAVVGQKIASHMALHVGRFGSEVQTAGGLGYEGSLRARPRWWTLPVVAPAIVGTAAITRLLDKIDPDDSDTLGYLLVAKRRAL